MQWLEAELLPDVDDSDGEATGEPSLQSTQDVSSTRRPADLDQVLLVGCSSGLLRMYDLKGNLVLSSTLHHSGVKSLRLRGYGSPDRTQDLLILFEDSVVARVDGSTIISVLRAWGGGGRVAANLSHCKWKMASSEVLTDVACCGLDEQVCCWTFGPVF